jgi:hypothetical protein
VAASKHLTTELDDNARIEEVRSALTHAHRKIARMTNKHDEMLAATYQAVRDALAAVPTLPPIAAPVADRRRKKAEVALPTMTDWQGAKKTPSYNSQVMRERVLRFCQKTETLTAIQRADHPVRDAVLTFGGDMVEGLFNFPTQVFEIDATIFEQWVNVSMLIADVARWALRVYDHVTVVPEWGNHGRIGSKRDAVPKSDNFDRMCYEHAKIMLADQKRLTWQDCPEDIQRIEIGEYRALLIHGDEVGRNGFASPSTIVQHVNRWRSGAYDWNFRDVYMGHYHTHCEWAMANGEGTVYQTGSTESENRYAGVNLAASAKPSQRLHFIDPIKGRVTAQYKVHLDGS